MNSSYPSVTLKPGREKSFVNHHPWLFSGAILSQENARNGEIVTVKTAEGKPLGFGFFDSESQISVRLFDFLENPDSVFDQIYWSQKIRNAFSLRKSLIISPETNSFRLINAEGDYFPGLIADVYSDTVVYQLLIPGTQNIMSLIENGFLELGFKKIHRQQIAEKLPNPETIQILENGFKFNVDYKTGQKTGFFLDQRDNRSLVRQLSKGRSVLNAFGFTGGFSIYAKSGGAKTVTTVDISKEAVGQSIENYILNFPNDSSHQAIESDCFNYLREMNETYDLIVLDPPAFAKSAKAVSRAARGYKDINMQAMKKLPAGGLLVTFSCSQHISRELFQKIVFAAAVDAGRNAKILYQLSQPADHPVCIFHPEGEYLKGLVLSID